MRPFPIAIAAIAIASCTSTATQTEARDAIVVVALSERDSVALFDARSLDRLATFPVGNNPHEIAASPDGRLAYIANAQDTMITVLEVYPLPRLVTHWPLPDSIQVHDVAVSEDGRTVWATSGERATVLAFDASSGSVTQRYLTQRAGPWMIESRGPSGNLVIANLEGGAVTLLEPTTGTQRVLDGIEGEIDAAPTRDGSEVWSVNYLNDSLTVFDARTGQVRSRQVSGHQAARVIFTPDGGTALTVNSGDSSIVAFDIVTKERRATVLVPSGPKVIALSGDGRRAYITHPERGALTMIDVASMSLLRSIDVPGMPDGIVVMQNR